MCPKQIKIKLSEIGQYVKDEIEKTNNIRQNIEIKEYVIMPNHVHMIVRIIGDLGTVHRAPTIEKFGVPAKKSIPTLIRYLKGGVTRTFNQKHKCNMPIWQRGFYEHIIRNEKEYYEICEYIEQNPLRWMKGE